MRQYRSSGSSGDRPKTRQGKDDKCAAPQGSRLWCTRSACSSAAALRLHCTLCRGPACPATSVAPSTLQVQPKGVASRSGARDGASETWPLPAAVPPLQLPLYRCSSQGASRTVLLQDTQDLAAGDVRHLSNAVRVPKDYANLRRGQTLPGELAHVLGDLTRVDLQPRRRRPPVRQSRLRDTLPVSRKASRRAKPEVHKLTRHTHAGGAVRRGAGRAARSKAAQPAAPRSCQLRLQAWPAERRSAQRNAPLAVHAPHDCEWRGLATVHTKVIYRAQRRKGRGGRERSSSSAAHLRRRCSRYPAASAYRVRSAAPRWRVEPRLSQIIVERAASRTVAPD